MAPAVAKGFNVDGVGCKSDAWRRKKPERKRQEAFRQFVTQSGDGRRLRRVKARVLLSQICSGPPRLFSREKEMTAQIEPPIAGMSVKIARSAEEESLLLVRRLRILIGDCGCLNGAVETGQGPIRDSNVGFHRRLSGAS
jgi:hypothetical protein